MNFTFSNRKITSILSVIPRNESSFEDEIPNYPFPSGNSMKLKRVMGYDKHRIVENGVCISDLCVFGLKKLFDENIIEKSEIDALVVITQSPDYLMPPTSYVIHGMLGLKQDMICLDINQGCAGFEIGLIQAFSLLSQDSIKKVVVINADVLSRKVSRSDRNSFPLIGDAATITIVERSDSEEKIFCNLKCDGSRSGALIIPAGGLRLPSSSETRELRDDGTGNLRSQDNLCMNGADVFNFVMTEVPPMIKELVNFANTELGSIDYYLFHQPNKFMVEKIADKLEIPYEKMPSNIVQLYGNSSSATVPVNICQNLGEKLIDKCYTVCFAGFGVGLTWSSILMKLDRMKFCSIAEY